MCDGDGRDALGHVSLDAARPALSPSFEGLRIVTRPAFVLRRLSHLPFHPGTR
ncbi:hypothetical protein GCM10022248_58100 [Nonomuraea soli]